MRAKLLILFLFMSSRVLFSQPETLIYHEIKTDASGKIVPWFSSDPGDAYSHVIQSVWRFWDTMRVDMNGLPYYMNHQVWTPGVDDTRGIGGDQLQMALSSWLLLYQYTGNERVKENMKFMAGYYLTHGLSSSGSEWADIPYPYNTLIYSGIFDGDMVIGRNYTQPDKAGSFGLELVHLYKLTGTQRHGQTPAGIYLESAVNIANTLAKHMIEGNDTRSPLPFKVNAVTGETGKLLSNNGDRSVASQSDYTTNWSGTMELFLELIKMNAGETTLYQHALENMLAWMKKYPLKNNKWGPFFEDVPGWSDTQINAVTFAQFMMNHREQFTDWKSEVKGIFSWVYEKLGNIEWEKYGAIVVNEQTAYQTPGNSHSSRQASAELQYAALSGDPAYVSNAKRVLNWATYMVDDDGKNCYPRDEVWMTDGYGDYVRHFLRAMSFSPGLAPADKNHLLSSTSVIQLMEYPPNFNRFMAIDVPADKIKKALVFYRTFDLTSTEVFRMTVKPSQIFVGNKEISELADQKSEGWSWKPLDTGGVLTVTHQDGNRILVMGK